MLSEQKSSFRLTIVCACKYPEPSSTPGSKGLLNRALLHLAIEDLVDERVEVGGAKGCGVSGERAGSVATQTQL
jgi:hypothetical protein